MEGSTVKGWKGILEKNWKAEAWKDTSWKKKEFLFFMFPSLSSSLIFERLSGFGPFRSLSLLPLMSPSLCKGSPPNIKSSFLSSSFPGLPSQGPWKTHREQKNKKEEVHRKEALGRYEAVFLTLYVHFSLAIWLRYLFTKAYHRLFVLIALETS